MHRYHVAFGANLGDPADMWRRAQEGIRALPHVRGFRASRLYRTAAVGAAGSPEYGNAACVAESPEEPLHFFRRLRLLELQLGRARPGHWAPRSIDLDLVLADAVRQDPDAAGEPAATSAARCFPVWCHVPGELEVPHPRMHYRRFVLAPLAEVAPDARHPLLGKRVDALLGQLDEVDAGRRVTRLAGGGLTEAQVRHLAAVAGFAPLTRSAAAPWEAHRFAGLATPVGARDGQPSNQLLFILSPRGGAVPPLEPPPAGDGPAGFTAAAWCVDGPHHSAEEEVAFLFASMAAVEPVG